MARRKKSWRSSPTRWSRRGVKEIDGDVVADDSYLAPARFPSGWTVDDTVWSYGAAVSAIARERQLP